MIKKKKYKGLWLFGLSGYGKTYVSKKIAKKIKNSFLIDGDVVRSLVSFDLGYSLKDRIKQNKRVLGLAKIAILNNQYFNIHQFRQLMPTLVNIIILSIHWIAC